MLALHLVHMKLVAKWIKMQGIMIYKFRHNWDEDIMTSVLCHKIRNKDVINIACIYLALETHLTTYKWCQVSCNIILITILPILLAGERSYNEHIVIDISTLYFYVPNRFTQSTYTQHLCVLCWILYLCHVIVIKTIFESCPS